MEAPGGQAITAHGIHKSYGDLMAVAGIDFEVSAGECFGFLGPNGAGKSTMMKMLYRTALVDQGQLRIFGLEVGSGQNDRAIKRRLGVVPQENNLDENLTVRENLEVFLRFYSVPSAERKKRVDRLLDAVELAGRQNSKVIELSGGMKRRLLIARGLLGDPDMLVLDEPTTGLDPQARQQLWNLLEELRRKSMTLILTTHYMDEAEKLCDRLVFMDHGKIVAEGEPQALIEERVQRFAVEFKDLDDAECVALDTAVDGLSERTRRYGSRCLVFTEQPEAVVEVAHRKMPDRPALVRRSNLEDVFLEITGHSLEENR